MNDTSPEITAKLHEMIQRKTPLERVKMGWSMYETSKHLITCAILRENPSISQPDLRKEVFLRFYRDDFSSEERDRIIAFLAEAPLS